jgi:hypothetical protein
MEWSDLGSKQLDPVSPNEKNGVLKANGSQILPNVSTILSKSKRHQDADSPLRKVAQSARAEAEALVDPRAVWAKLEHESLAAELNTHLPEEILTGIKAAVGVICTIGRRLEERASWLFSASRYSEGYLLDLVGTLAVASLAKQAARTLSDKQHASYWAPGDDEQDWSLSAQRTLFEWVPAERIGVRLTAQNVMVPAKSLSFLLLSGSGLDIKRCLTACHHCVWNGGCDLQAMRETRGAG